MAEWRALNRRVCTDPRLAPLPLDIQLLYERLILMSDDFGRLGGDPLQVALQCIPGSSSAFQEVPAWLFALRERGLIRWYFVNGVNIIELTDWDGEQPAVLIGKRTKSKYPEWLPDCPHAKFQEVPGSSRKFHAIQDKTRQEGTHSITSKNTHAREATSAPAESSTFSEATASGASASDADRQGTLLAAPDPVVVAATAARSRRSVFAAWVVAFSKGKQAKMKPADKRDRTIVQRLKEGTTLEEMIQAVQGYALDPWRHVDPVRHELATLLRDRGRVETGLTYFREGPPASRDAPAQVQSTYDHAVTAPRVHSGNAPADLGGRNLEDLSWDEQEAVLRGLRHGSNGGSS